MFKNDRTKDEEKDKVSWGECCDKNECDIKNATLDFRPEIAILSLK